MTAGVSPTQMVDSRKPASNAISNNLYQLPNDEDIIKDEYETYDLGGVKSPAEEKPFAPVVFDQYSDNFDESSVKSGRNSERF